MRVTGGIYRGRPLRSSRGLEARPTTDKVRQSIFNILMNDIDGKDVLDLFAGSGALGIEALSRGARSAAFVEIGRPQVMAIKSNLLSMGIKAEVVQSDYVKACRSLNESGYEFDIIFADPPYEKVTPGEVIRAVLQYSLLRPDGFLIIEHKVGVEIMSRIMTPLKNRKFGQTEVTFYAHKKEKDRENGDISGNL
jgi:16S rRNA (guanine966-N2)-methyltransferase